MPRPKTISDDDILRVARQCFQQKGHSVSTRDIAKAAGISQAVLYQRFGGKEEMFLRAMMPEPPNIEAVLERPDGLEPRDYLRTITLRLIRHFQTLVPAVVHLMTYPNFDVSLVDAHEHLLANKLHLALAARLRTLVDGGDLAEHPPQAMATTMIGLAHSVGMHSTMTGTETGPSEDELDAIVEVLWRGFQPPAQR